jgi:hypothetical protein
VLDSRTLADALANAPFGAPAEEKHRLAG